MIIFVRHGTTQYNENGWIQGLADAPLTKKGLDEAQSAALKLKDTHIDKIYASPLIRAYKTAEIINQYHDLEIIKEPRLLEFDVGPFSGTKLSDYDKATIEDFWKHPEKHGAQSNEDFKQKVLSFFKSVENTNENILIVSHGGVYRLINQYLTGVFDLGTIKNCEPIVIKE